MEPDSRRLLIRVLVWEGISDQERADMTNDEMDSLVQSVEKILKRPKRARNISVSGRKTGR